VYQYVRRTAVPVRWRDSQSAYRFHRVRETLREIASEPEGQSDWQPHVLVFTHGLERRARVLRLASWISGGSGLVTAAILAEGEGSSEQTLKRCAQLEAELHAEIEELHLDIYPLAVAAPDLRVAMSTVLQAWGVGPIRSNTILVNWIVDDGTSSAARLWYGRMLKGAVRLKQHVVVLDTDEASWDRLAGIAPGERRIDVWWFDDESSHLMLLFAHLMTRTSDWEDAEIRVLAPAAAEDSERTHRELARRIDEARIDAAVEVVSDPQIDDVVARSRDAALVYIPLRVVGMQLQDAFEWGISTVLARLPIVALVAAAQDVQLAEDDEPAVASEPPDPKAAGAHDTDA